MIRPQTVRRGRGARVFVERSREIVRINFARKKILANQTYLFIVLAFEFLDKVVGKSVVKVLSTQINGNGGGHDFEDTFLNREEGDI